MQLWEEASNAASAVLNQTDLYSWPSSLNTLFEKQSLATIWQFSPALAGANTYEETYSFFTGSSSFCRHISGSVQCF